MKNSKKIQNKTKKKPINIYINNDKYRIEGRETKGFNIEKPIYRRRRTTLGQKIILGIASILSLGAIAVSFGLVFGVPQHDAISKELPLSISAPGASLLKLNASNSIVKTTDGEIINALFKKGGTFTGALETTRKVEDFQPKEFVTREYSDSKTGSAPANSNDKLATNEYLNNVIDSIVLIDPNETSRNLVNGPVTTTRIPVLNDEFVTKELVDQQFNSKLDLVGGDFTGSVTLNKGSTTFNDNEFVTKEYNDTRAEELRVSSVALLSFDEFISKNKESIATGPILISPEKTMFEGDELIPKRYFDEQLDNALIRPLNYLDTDPLIPENEGRYYTYEDNECDPGPESTWRGWRAKNIDYKLVDSVNGLTTQGSFAENATTPENMSRGFLSYFGVEYNLAKLIRKYPENVKIAFSLIDTRIGVNLSHKTNYYNLSELNNTQIATTFDGEVYEVYATFSKEDGTIKITSGHNGQTNCYVSVNGITLSGYVPSFIADQKTTDPIPEDNNPVFREV